MIFGETLVFSLALLGTAAVLFLLVYFIITLSDLECDYLNARECCDRLNCWLHPKLIAHGFTSLLLLLHGQVVLFLCNLPLLLWLLYEAVSLPGGNLGKYDPAEILNRGQLRRHLRECLIYIGFYLLFFFVYLYCFILALLKGDPINRHFDDQIVTEI